MSRREKIVQEMGLGPLWRLRSPVDSQARSGFPTQVDWLFVDQGIAEQIIAEQIGEQIIGEQINEQTDDQEAQKLLDNMLLAIGLKRGENVYVASSVSDLSKQIERLQPKIIVALGLVRGKTIDYKGIPMVLTYHPAYLLHNMPDKAKAWEDLCFAKNIMNASLD